MYCSHSPTVVWRFISSQPKLVPTLRKIFTNRQGLKNAENSNCSSSNGFRSQFDGDEAVCKSARDPDDAVGRFLPRPSILFWVNRAVVFFDALEWLSFALSYLLTARNGSIFFLGPCQVLVVHSFAFSFRLSKVRSLIEWLLRSFFVDRGNQMLRILNSLSTCCDVEMFLEGDSVVQHYVFFSPPDG